jgi:aryl-alcohol dehydrogenase-like predicted oxidoreductase
MKAASAVRYVGITTSEGRRHDLLEQIMRNEPIDFVQFSYNVVDREAEQRLLPLASERGIAVIVNRPFRQGALTQRLKDEPLPEWAAEVGASRWSQLILKFILSHPAVTVAIPATTRVDHVRENLSAAAGPMPDLAMRKRISAYVQAL